MVTGEPFHRQLHPAVTNQFGVGWKEQKHCLLSSCAVTTCAESHIVCNTSGAREKQRAKMTLFPSTEEEHMISKRSRDTKNPQKPPRRLPTLIANSTTPLINTAGFLGGTDQMIANQAARLTQCISIISKRCAHAPQRLRRTPSQLQH